MLQQFDGPAPRLKTFLLVAAVIGGLAAIIVLPAYYALYVQRPTSIDALVGMSYLSSQKEVRIWESLTFACTFLYLFAICWLVSWMLETVGIYPTPRLDRRAVLKTMVWAIVLCATATSLYYFLAAIA